MSGIAEKAVIAKLLQTTAITDLVGQRIFPRMAPPKDGSLTSYGQKPYLIVLRPPGQQTGHTASSQIQVARTPIFIACVAETYTESRTLSDPISTALDPDGWTGSKTWGGVEVASCMQGGTYDQSAWPELADEIGFPIEFVTFELEHSTQ